MAAMVRQLAIRALVRQFTCLNPWIFVFTLSAAVVPSLLLGQEEKPAVVTSTPEEQTTLPKLVDMPLPSAEDLLRSRPFDWLALKGGDVLVIDALPIRPDLLGVATIRHEMATHVYNRILKHKPYKEAELTSLRQYIKDAEKAKEFDARDVQLKQTLDEARDRMESLKPATSKIQVTLRDGSVDPDYLLELRNIDSVVYFEDLLLRRADRLIAEGQTSLAYDLLLLVARRYRDDIVPIRTELESEEQSLIAQIKELETQRSDLRKLRDDLAAPKNKNSTAAKMRLTAVEKTIVAIAGEIKDLDDDLKAIRAKLRFVRPRDFPNPEPPRKDDLLLPTWPRFEEVYQRLVFQDSDEQFKRGNAREALRLLEEIWKPNVENAELAGRLGRVADVLIADMTTRQDYRQARHFLNDLASRVPTSAVVEKWRQELAQKAATTIQDARTFAMQGDAAGAARTVDLAARIWPDATGLKDAHRELCERYQILRVGVLELGGDSGTPDLPSVATERERWLAESKLFEPIGISDQGVRYRSSYFSSWEPTDLGRRVRFDLKLRRADWEARPLVTAADFHAEVLSQLDPQSDRYNERLAGFVNGVTVTSPSEFIVHFRQQPLRPESLWQTTIPVGVASFALNDEIANSGDSLGRLRFQRAKASPNEARYLRVRPQPATTRQRRIEEIDEERYDSWDRILQGLLRGEISMSPLAALRDLKALQDDGRFNVIPYALPRSHLLLFNPQTKALADGQLRRAMLHGIPRERLLKGTILKDVAGTHARLVTSPFATTSYGHNRLLPQPEYDPPLAAALALTARKQLGGKVPVLKLSCPSDPTVKEVCVAMIEEWRRVSIEVELADAASPHWDICYRTIKSIEPLMDLWPLLTLQDSARVEGLQFLPESTRRDLLELERIGDWTNATKLLHRLLANQLIEARYIPLWEVDEYLIARKNITGLASRPMHAYDDVERWTVQSWYPQDAP